MNNYEELAEIFFDKSYQLKQIGHQQKIDKCLKGEIFVLLLILNQNGSIMPSELSNFMSISTARVTAILNNLENKKMIEREIDKIDRRKIQVKLTKLGENEAKTHQKKVLENIVDIFRFLGEHDSKELVRITSKLVEIASNKSNN